MKPGGMGRFILVLPFLLSCMIASSQDLTPDWVGEGFFSCHETEMLAAHFRNDTFYGEGSEPAPSPLTHFKVVDLRIQEDGEKYVSVLLLLESSVGVKTVILAKTVFKNKFGRANFGLIASAYFRGMKDIPADWSTGQRAAIQNRAVIVGMDRHQVVCAVGYPEHVNDYGNGLTQEVYDDGALLIYWGSSGLVTNIQTFR
jgi:hypothetical protein